MNTSPSNKPPDRAASNGLAGLRVLSFESRRAAEMAKLIAGYGGAPTVAPSMQEVPLASNTEALAFARGIAEGSFDVVILLTGVGTRMLARVAETAMPRETFVAALGRAALVARGPKPVAALAEMGLSPALLVPEPNTWKDLLRALDANAAKLPLGGRRVAVQEYGSSNAELLAGLAERGAMVTRVPVYQWSLPDDVAPLRAAVAALSRGEFDLALFTTSVQVTHLLQLAAEMKLEAEVRRGLSRAVIGSIGPVTSEALREQGIAVDFEPQHPKMGFLVNEAARLSAGLLGQKRSAK